MKLHFEDKGQEGQSVVDWIHAVATQYDMTEDDFYRLIGLYKGLLELSERFAIAQVYIDKLENDRRNH